MRYTLTSLVVSRNKLVAPKSKIEQLEQGLLLDNLPEPYCPLVHTFSDGVYVREITMPSGSLILGKEHTTKHLNMISKGSCILYDLDTGTTKDIIAPYTFESKAGVRKVLYVVDECVWSTIHITTETDISKLEQTLTRDSDVYKQLRNE